jgi:CBS domain-containing protein
MKTPAGAGHEDHMRHRASNNPERALLLCPMPALSSSTVGDRVFRALRLLESSFPAINQLRQHHGRTPLRKWKRCAACVILTGPRRAWWLEIASKGELARYYVKSHARKVKDVMTTEVVSITDTTELADIAILLETKRIKRVPVLRDAKIVGIVSRADLVRALAATKSKPVADADTDDRTIRRRLLTELKGQQWFKLWAADILVKDRVVHFWFSHDESERERGALRVAAENIPGVRRVEEHIVRTL